MADEPVPDPRELPSEASLAERLQRVRDELSDLETPTLDDEAVEAEKARIQANLRAASQVQLPEFPELPAVKRPRNLPGSLKGKDSSYDGMGVGLTVAYTLVGFPGAGIFLGWLADRSLGGDTWKGIGALVGATLGLYVAITTLNRTGANR